MRQTIWMLMVSLTALISAGCVGGSDGDNNNGNGSDGGVLAKRTCAKSYYDSTASSLLNNCVSCHSSGGQAESTGFVLNAPLSSNKDANFNVLYDYVVANGNKIVLKGQKKVAHGGGVQLSSSQAVIMQNFVDYANGAQVCKVVDTGSAIDVGSISLLSPANTLRSASFKLQGKAPSEAELNSVSSIDDIDSYLDKYMESDVFYEWLAQSFNDFLLTDFYMPGRNAEDLLNRDDFSERRWYDRLRDNGDISNNMRRDIYESINIAIAREPINLVMHVIKENRPFSEILTADYLLVNPYSARTYGVHIPGFTVEDEDTNTTSELLQENFKVDDLREVKLDGIPHAGLLTTITYLNRFPSTDTNLDRHRSAKTQLFFFDTDILALASRPIDAVDVIGNSATWTNPNCTVCHNVMEPISSAFSNWDNSGRYRPQWRIDLAPYSREPGISIDHKAPKSAENNLLQWLAGEMVKDDHFARASVKIFYKALFGYEPLKKPADDDANYGEALQAYNFEQGILESIKDKFIASGMNAKVVIKALIKSPLYRASGLGVENSVLSKNLGQGHLISPEELNRKIYDTMGYYWNRYIYSSYSDNNNTSNHRLLNSNEYRTLYGGINSGSISKRVDELNGVMANIQLRMALQMSCFPVSRDFYFDLKDRKLFPYVTSTTEPILDGAIADIKKNIQYLHKHILNEDLAINDPEIEATYKLFYETYLEGKAGIDAGDVSGDLLGECQLHNDPVTFESLYSTGRASKRVYQDPNYVIRSWSAVIAYLLSDFKFVYEQSAE